MSELNLGDRAPGTTISFDFNTHKADGTPITLAGTPAISVYKNSTTESTSGVTLTVDYDSRTGMHHVVIDTSSDGTFYATGNDFSVVITTGTVDSISAVGAVVAHFSLGRSNISHFGGTAVTGRDIGASVLLSSGTGTGQVDVTSGVIKSNMTQILGTAVSTPATAGILDVNVKNINNIATTSVTTVSAYQGATQPLNFTGTGASALVKTDMVDIAGAVVSTSTAQIGVNAVQIGGSVPTSATIGTVNTVTNQLTAAAIATGVWQDAIAGDFTVASSIGKALYIANIAPGASGGHMISGTNAGTTTLGALTITGATTLTGAVTATNVSNDINGCNVQKINSQSVTASAGITVNANLGTTQPLNFTGTGASALVKTDMVDIAGAAVSTSTAQIGVNAVQHGGIAQTGRDIGASVLLSPGTGTGQISLSSGAVTVGTNNDKTGYSLAVDQAVNVTKWNGTAVATPATAGIPEVNVKNINNVATTSVTTVSAYQGQTQPFNFTGTGVSALVKADMVDIAGAAVSTSSAQIGVNVVNLGGTAQTGRDIGASVLISSGTGTGQLSLNAGVVASNITQIDGSALVTHAVGMMPGDLRYIVGTAVSTTIAQLGVNMVQCGTTPVTARDIGASVLLSVGAGSGQVDVSGGVIKSNLVQVDGITLTTHSAGKVPADVRDIAGATVSTSIAQIGVNVVSSSGGVPALGDIADAVWDEALSGHSTAGTAGKALSDAASGSSPSTIADAVWDEALSGHSTAGTAGKALSDAGSAGDPWSTTIPGAYGAGTAGYILGTNLNATISGIPSAVWGSGTRTLTGGVTVTTNNDKTGYSISGTKQTLDALNDITAASVWAAATRTLTAFGTLIADTVDAIWDEATSGHSTAGTTGKALIDAASITAPSAATIADAVWDEALSGHTTAGTAGKVLSTAGAAGDPWSTTLPGAYGSGTAGYILGNTLNANLVSIDGNATNGYNATLKLKKLDIYNATGDAVKFASLNDYGLCVASNNNVALFATGTTGLYVAGSIAGLTCEGGQYGIGANFSGGTISGSAISIVGHSDGIKFEVDEKGINIISAGNGIEITSDAKGINIASDDSGIYVASTAGIGAHFEGIAGMQCIGVTSDGLQCSAGGNGAGASFNGYGSGPGVGVRGGASGKGAFINGRGGSDALSIVAENHANGVTILADGRGHGVYVKGGADSAYGHGIYAEGGSINGSGMQLKRGGTGGHDLTFETPDCTVNSNVISINDSDTAAVLLSLSARSIATDIIDSSAFTPTTEEFEVLTINDADAAHYRDRWAIFYDGALALQARVIKNYLKVGGKGHFVCDAFTQAPVNGDRIIIV